MKVFEVGEIGKYEIDCDVVGKFGDVVCGEFFDVGECVMVCGECEVGCGVLDDDDDE